MHSLVIFWGKCQFKGQMPENVLNNKYTGYIKSKKEVLLTDGEVDRICFQLQKVKENTPLLYVASKIETNTSLRIPDTLRGIALSTGTSIIVPSCL